MGLPILVVSDGPRMPSGLGRIARDLVRRLAGMPEWDVAQAGLDPDEGLTWPDWQYYRLAASSQEDWGFQAIPRAWQAIHGTREGVLLTIWDPARCYPITQVEGPWRLWGYFPVDAENPHRAVGGPAGEAVQRYEQVLAYGRWGSRVLKATRGSSVSYLPHGLELEMWTPAETITEGARVQAMLGNPPSGTLILGCVATNQPRKDLATYFEALAVLRARGWPIRGWLHTDQMVKAWAVPQLIDDFGLRRKVTVTTTLTDQQLAQMYRACIATVAPGLGEGFGYPAVESLACGTPCVSFDYGGGVELTPLQAWRVPVATWRWEGCYTLKRPVMQAEDVANAVERAIRWRQAEPDIVRAYCVGAVAHLDWTALWPRWASWFRASLTDLS